MEADEKKPVYGTRGDALARKPGPVPGAATRKFTVLLEEPLGEWAKSQPGGLSETVRRLLSAARDQSKDRHRS